ncbi:NTF2-like domain containing protein [Senna tora]|uniref:NTF2-like domain containing protein n=1 Tax=Senna tora TaxID=362788 RepID=A0A834SYY4_9FABA|nr:NTF2-like domain containing protein [Senna tora]
MRSSLSQLLLFHRQTLSRLGSKQISSSSMDRASSGTDGLDRSREAGSKEACDFGEKKRLSDTIIPHILRMYGSTATAVDFEIYAPDASFEDPLMCAHGVKQIKSAFYSLKKVFSESRIVEYTVEENMISPGKQEILIDNKQHYKFLGKDIDLASLIRLYVVEGKVVRHEDWWDKKPFWNKERVKVPLVGRVAEMTRRGSMLLTHALMGFGKDPSA